VTYKLPPHNNIPIKSLLTPPFFKVDYERDGFHWNSKTQNDVLGAFFTLHWATQLPGGILAARYGTKLIFGLANFIGCITCMLVPLTAYLNFRAMLWLRLLQGFVAGAAWPGEKNNKFIVD
jgi:MFS family permease